MKKLKKTLLSIGVFTFISLFISSMIALVVHAFNPFQEKEIIELSSFGCVLAIFGIVCIITSEAMENSYVQKKEEKI